jgi:hypothetical protein
VIAFVHSLPPHRLEATAKTLWYARGFWLIIPAPSICFHVCVVSRCRYHVSDTIILWKWRVALIQLKSLLRGIECLNAFEGPVAMLAARGINESEVSCVRTPLLCIILILGFEICG